MARLLGAAVLASAAGCGSSQGNPLAQVDAGTQIGTFSYGTAAFSGAFTETDQVIAFATYSSVVGPVPSDGGAVVYLQLTDSKILLNPRNSGGPSFGCAFTFPGTSLQPGQYTPADVIAFWCGVLVETEDAGVAEWAQSTFALDITATGPALSDGSGNPVWHVPTATLSAQLVGVEDDLNPTDAGLSFSATVAPPDCANTPFECMTY
jgi:hypothetical protein